MMRMTGGSNGNHQFMYDRENEEQVLARCLDSVADLMDEIIIVDTGSTDRTKEVAARYTDQIYDFTWIGDFSAARNFSFSKATMEYIYAPDADEVLDAENRARFLDLKNCLLPEIEIVQMWYVTEAFNTVMNVKRELRPKLFKRLRTFTWIDPVHETVRLDPVVFDSDIEIQHKPLAVHGGRDFEICERIYARDGELSPKLRKMYAKELLKCGELTDFERACGFSPESGRKIRWRKLAGRLPVCWHIWQDCRETARSL